MLSSADYYRRLICAYVLHQRSHLSFWHEEPKPSSNAFLQPLGEYYLLFSEKADYAGPFDEEGIPLLDYRGSIGRQYNPIAIAQYGLANFNQWLRTKDIGRRAKFLRMADWLAAHLEENEQGVPVWMHHFDWRYRTPLKAPWYSALAQGQGISLLARACRVNGSEGQHYLDAARAAFEAFTKPMGEGGVTFWDKSGDPWFEEYLVTPPTHILNGFISAVWGVFDYHLLTGDMQAKSLFEGALQTIKKNLHHYDVGFWSRYELSQTRLPMLASPFYHKLHIAQLQVMHRLTGEEVFSHYAQKWLRCQQSLLCRGAALLLKVAFKVLYY